MPTDVHFVMISCTFSFRSDCIKRGSARKVKNGLDAMSHRRLYEQAIGRSAPQLGQKIGGGYYDSYI